MSELAPIGWLVGGISLEHLPSLKSSGGANDLWGEFDLSVERGRSVNSEEFGSVFDKWGRAEMSIYFGLEA